MNISSISGRSTIYTGSSAAKTGVDYLAQVNAKYTKANFRKGSFLPSSASSASKPAVTVALELLNKAADQPDLAESFEKKIAKIVDANKKFGDINLTGQKLAVKGYLIDRNGKITCHGTDLATEKDFSIELGNVKDKTTDYANKIYDHFEISPSALLLATYKK